jgi:hypothetical protein
MAALSLMKSKVMPRSDRELHCSELQAHLEAAAQAGALLRQQLQRSLQTQDALAVALQADEEVSTWMSALVQVMYLLTSAVSAPHADLWCSST